MEEITYRVCRIRLFAVFQTLAPNLKAHHEHIGSQIVFPYRRDILFLARGIMELKRDAVPIVVRNGHFLDLEKVTIPVPSLGAPVIYKLFQNSGLEAIH